MTKGSGAVGGVQLTCAMVGAQGNRLAGQSRSCAAAADGPFVPSGWVRELVPEPSLRCDGGQRTTKAGAASRGQR